MSGVYVTEEFTLQIEKRIIYIEMNDQRAGGAIEELCLEGRDAVEEIELEGRRCRKGVIKTEKG